MIHYLPWTIVAVLALIVIALVVALSKSNKSSAVAKTENARFHANEPYYVAPADRQALATFCADHLDDVNHPNRGAVVRILAAWGSAK